MTLCKMFIRFCVRIIGVCMCNAGYVGSDCSINKNLPPTITGLTMNPCDVQETSCKYVVVSGPKFAENTDLRCGIEIFVVRFYY